MENIYVISKMEIEDPLDQKHIYIKASGSTNTIGWQDVSLLPRVYITPPSNGIWEIDFTGNKLEISSPAFKNVSASLKLDIPDWLLGVKIIAHVNSIEYLLPK